MSDHRNEQGKEKKMIENSEQNLMPKCFIRDEPVCEVFTIEPKLAEQMLTGNVSNRDYRHNGKHAREMRETLRSGEWTLNGETIKIGDDGTLIDGQHRLNACVDTGIPITTFVAMGLATKAFKTVDHTLRRSIADQLKGLGFPNPSGSAAIAKSLYIVDRTNSLKAGFSSGSTAMIPTVNQVVEYAVDHFDEIEAGLNKGYRVNRFLPVSPRIASVFYILAARADIDDADFFFDKMVTGSELTEGSPILALRRALEIAESKKSSSESSTLHKSGLISKAWTRFREGVEVKSLQFRVGGARPDDHVIPQ